MPAVKVEHEQGSGSGQPDGGEDVDEEPEPAEEPPTSNRPEDENQTDVMADRESATHWEAVAVPAAEVLTGTDSPAVDTSASPPELTLPTPPLQAGTSSLAATASTSHHSVEYPDGDVSAGLIPAGTATAFTPTTSGPASSNEHLASGPAPSTAPPSPAVEPTPEATTVAPVPASDPEAAERAAPGPVPLGMPPDVASLLGAVPLTAADPAKYSPTRFARDLPRVIAIANQKGGVGKTTTAVNLGAGLAELGYRVLVIDLDPQGNATTGLGINPRNLESSIYDVMMHDVALDDCIEPTSLRNLFVCPATIDLAGAEIELVPAFSRELKLRRALEPVLEDFDFVVIDCPPSLGLITVNALAAATEVVVPIQCEYYALEGLGQLLRNVKLVQTNLNPRLEVSAIVLTMFDARTKLAEQVVTEVRTHFGPKVCRNIVPRTVRLSEAPSFGQPIVVFDPTSRGAIAYRELAKEVSGGTPQRVG